MSTTTETHDPIAELAAKEKENGNQVCLLVLDDGVTPPLDFDGFRAGAKVSSLENVKSVAEFALQDGEPDA